MSGQKAVVLILLFLLGGTVYAQKAKLAGTIVDAKTGETLIGVNVVLADNPSKGTITDLDGQYQLPLEPGTYDIQVSYISYQAQKFTGVEIKPGEVTRLNIQLDEAVMDLDAVEISAKARRNTATAIMVVQKKAARVIDGISAEDMSKLGASDAAEALQRVTGVSVQEGKYVNVRGLGDRYSKITMNKADIPGLDPNRNTVQMDLFPSNVIENIVVHKSFTPDLAGDFTGGHVNIETKDFPEKFSLQFSTSWGYNPQASLNDQYLSYEGGDLDWIGIDDGTRDIPDVMQNEIDNLDPSGQTGPDIIQQGFYTPSELRPLTGSFNHEVVPTEITSFLNNNHEFGMGNQTELFGKTLGYNIAFSYDQSFKYYDNGQSAFYEAKPEASPLADYQYDERGETENKMAGLVNFNYKFSNNSKASFTFLRNQGGIKYTRFRRGPFPYESASTIAEVRDLGFIERSFNSFQLKGEHVLPSLNKFKIAWLTSYTKSKQDEPDLRIINNLIDPNTNIPFMKTNNGPTRTYRFMDEVNFDNKLDLTLPTEIAGNNAKIKAGGAFVYKERNRDQTGFELQPNGRVKMPDGFNDYMDDAIINPQTGKGYYYIVDINDDYNNSYDGESYVGGAYAMIDLPLGDKWRIVTGVRYEHSQIDVKKKIYGYGVEDATGVELKEDDILPSLNITYHPMEDMNLRLGLNRTLARPVFQEVSSSQFYDYQDGLRKYGNPELKRTLITNIDLRWEYFFELGEMVSLSLFYKDFQNPIAQRYIQEAVNPEIRFFNSDEAETYGFEVEFRKKLDFIEALQNFSIGGNFSMIESVVEKPADEVENVNSVREQNGYERTEDTRPMFGQAPYLINGYLKYDNKEMGLSANAGFNMAGEKLMIITKGFAPYVYEQPRASLNFNISKSISEHLSFKLSVSNILDAPYEAVHHYDYLNNENEGDRIYYSYNLARTYSFGLKYVID